MSLVFYCGADFFKTKEAIDKKVAAFLDENKNGLVEKFDFDGDDRLRVLKDILKRRSLFDQLELVLVYGYFSAADLQKKNKELFNFLKKEAEEVKELEIKKQDPLKKKSDDFALIDAIGNRDIKKAVVFLNQALNDGQEPYAVLGQIIYQFRILLRVKSLLEEAHSLDGIIKKTNLHPFVAQKTSRQARQFELGELKKTFSRLADLDIKLKTGQIDWSAGLFQFILEI